jgi:AcrR family transcriptional regulator
MVAKLTKREEIYGVAAQVFQERGFAGTTIQAIAEALGIPKASAYHHIGSKEELFFEILMTGVMGLVQRLETIAAYPLSALDRLRLAIHDNMRSGVEEVHSPLALMTRDTHVLSPEHRAEFRQVQRRYEQVFLGIIEEGIANGEIRPLPNPRIAMFGILQMVGSFSRWYKPSGPLTWEATVLACQG